MRPAPSAQRRAGTRAGAKLPARFGPCGPSFPAPPPLPMTAPAIELIDASSAEQLAEIRTLFAEYADSLAVDLGFQDFEQELQNLPGDYARPRGALLLVRVDQQVAGCCALRPLDDVDYPNAAEMKRLFVRKMFRGFGLGRRLAEAALDAARQRGYQCVLLDTLDDMESARALYEDLGFEAIDPYYHNPLPGAHYLKAEID